MLPQAVDSSSVLIGEVRVSGNPQFVGIGLDSADSFGARGLAGKVFQLGGTGTVGNGSYQLQAVGPVPKERWVQVIIPLNSSGLGTTQRLILINEVAKGDGAEVSFRRFGIFNDAGAGQIQEPRHTLIDNPDAGDSLFCSISGECRAVSRKSVRCVVRATVRSVEGYTLSGNGQISLAVAGRGWVPAGAGQTSTVTGYLERRFTTKMTPRKNRLFSMADFSGIGCQVAQQIQ